MSSLQKKCFHTVVLLFIIESVTHLCQANNCEQYVHEIALTLLYTLSTW